MKKTSKILYLCLIIIICLSSNLFAAFFYSINCKTDELIKIDSETGEIEVIGSIGYDITSADLAYFQDRLFILNNTYEDGFETLENNNVELVEISPYNGSKISVKPVRYNGSKIALAEGFNAFSDVIKIAFTVNVDASSELLGDIDLDGNITNAKDYKTADIDALGINHFNNDLYSIDVEPEVKTSIYKLNNDATLSKIIDLDFSEYKANDIVIMNSILYFINHYDNKLHSINIDDTNLKNSVNINIEKSNLILGLSKSKENDICNIMDSDKDGVIDQWDECPSTASDSFVNKIGCTPQGLYTEDQMNQMVNSILLWGDTNGDNKINLIEAIKALRITSGVTEPNIK